MKLRIRCGKITKYLKYVLLLAMLLTGLVSIHYGAPVEALTDKSNGEFDVTMILGRPTSETMDVSLLSDRDCEVYLEWGPESHSLEFSSPLVSLESGITKVINLAKLSSGMKNYFRLHYRNLEDEAFNYTELYSFQMPREAQESFNFVIQSDSHLLNKADEELYKYSMEVAASLQPDLFIDLGDTFLNDQSKDGVEPTQEEVNATYIQQRQYFDIVARQTPLFLTIGNHEGEYGSFFDGTFDNIAAKSTLARTNYYTNPIPNTFYTGNIEEESLFGSPQNYYAYNWGDTLFVSIDPYRYSSVIPYGVGEERANEWDWTLGKEQYDWFRKTLEESDATFKFVFAHHAIGNMRGGADIASLYEWGGYDRRGKYLFDKMRSEWGKPIQEVMDDEGVTVFFQGHDHLFSRELVDNVTYLTLPKPAERVADIQSNPESYTSGDTLMNSGIINVKVETEYVEIDYVRHFIVADDNNKNSTGVVYRFRVDKDRNVQVMEHYQDDFDTYGSNEETLMWQENPKKNNKNKPRKPKRKRE